MTLLIILMAFALLVTIIATIADEYASYRGLTFFAWAMSTGLAVFLIIVTVNIVGYENTKETTKKTHTEQLATLNDGTGVEGRFAGGLFISRGYISDTQHYSYYVKNKNGSFNLHKRPADKSTIWQDATPETARVDITDKITVCIPRWWLMCDSEPKVEFARANFHIPEGSIGDEFRLDAE